MIKREYVEEALDNVRDSMRQYAQAEAETSDEDMLDAMVCEMGELLIANRDGDADAAYSLARHVAGLAVLYMARGLI
jgi:hypothetical protein